jgi:glucose/arabinose dehydrogenase
VAYAPNVRRTLLVIVAVACGLSACSSSKKATTTTGTRASTTPAPTTTAKPRSTTTKPAPPNFAAAQVRLTEIATGLEKPVAFSPRHGTNTLYVANQGGDIRALAAGKLAPTRVLDLRGQVSGGNEQGLLGITFSPDGTHLYVDFTDNTGDTHVQEYAMRGDVADVGSRRELLFVKQPFANHNGGEVLIGPDGMLYIGLGDGGSAGDPMNNGPNKSVLLGKILRINPTASATGAYSVPADNPFVSTPDARPEIWQWGLRNPWRFSFDRATGDLWIGDVGQNAYEEIDFAKAGAAGLNFGWSQREGTHRYKGARPAGAVDPVYEYSHADGGIAVTGGYVYRGKRIPNLVGAYLWADEARGHVIALQVQGGHVLKSRPLDAVVNTGLSSFGEDNAGELYALDLGGGRVLRIDPA